MKTYLLGLAVLAACVAPAAAETLFHVAPGGSDLNLGTRSKPFATLQRARQAVRMAGSDKARTVVVHAGSYELRSTFTLGRLDSGTSTRPVTWQAAPRETVKLIGGMSCQPRPGRRLRMRRCSRVLILPPAVGWCSSISGPWVSPICHLSRSLITALRLARNCSSTKPG